MKEVPDSEQGFDIEPVLPQQEADPSIEPPAFLLTSDKVRAVRFHPAKPGYEFRQVETFVEQVTETLRFLEAQLFQAQLDGHEKREEIYDLQERVSTLTATIEVFRATGDPVTASDGSYLTESKAVEQNAELTAVTAERDALVVELAAAREDADRGWAAEAELRRYMDETLKPWMEAQAAEAAQTPAVVEEASLDVIEDIAGEADAIDADSLDDVQVSPVAEPVVEVLAEPVVEPVIEVVAEPVAEPGVEFPAEPVVEPVAIDSDDSYAEKLAQAVAALDEEDLGDDFDEVADDDETVAEEESVAVASAESEIIVEVSAPASVEVVIEDLDEDDQDEFASTDDGWDVDPSISALAVAEETDDDDEADEASAPVSAPRLSILASSPEAAVLGDQAIIRDMPTASAVSSSGEAAPQPAGAPLPKLLASAPEVLAAETSAE